MTSTRFRHKIVLLLLAFVLATPWAASAGPRPGSAEVLGASTSMFLENLLSRAWTFLTVIRNKEGCHLDPNGRCTPVAPEPQPTIQTDEGCHIDPNGGCRS